MVRVEIGWNVMIQNGMGRGGKRRNGMECYDIVRDEMGGTWFGVLFSVLYKKELRHQED